MSSTEVEYMVLSLEHLDEVSDLLVNHFYTRDIITSGLRFSPENRLTLDLPHIRKCLASGLSVGAREKSTQRLVGVILNLIFTADSPPKPTLKNNNTEAEMMESRFCKIAALMTNKIDCPEDGRVLYSSRACTHSDFGRRGILMKLGEMLVTIASNQGFQMITTVVTNPFAEKVLLRLGCKVQTTFDFHTLEEGLLDVSRMDQKQFKIMTKYLSPTTPKSQL
ncbi:uncharacterized protein [Procambarus clarkii]|uniref:uncharacterized protein isoform X1 n=1 Tax=Procambarus clarkii TaxID=6728 RepID=UPI003743D017